MSGRRDLNSSRVFGEERVGDVRKDQPEHLRRPFLERAGIDVRPIIQDLDRSPDSGGRRGRHPSRTVVNDVTDDGRTHTGVAGDVGSGGWPVTRRPRRFRRHGGGAGRMRGVDQLSPCPRFLASFSIGAAESTGVDECLTTLFKRRMERATLAVLRSAQVCQDVRGMGANHTYYCASFLRWRSLNLSNLEGSHSPIWHMGRDFRRKTDRFPSRRERFSFAA
jgi:hypothetical protein